MRVNVLVVSILIATSARRESRRQRELPTLRKARKETTRKNIPKRASSYFYSLSGEGSQCYVLHNWLLASA